MARIRTDSVFGTLTDNPLTNVATTMNSAGLSGLAAVAGGDEAIIILDPNKVSGAPEIVVVSAHTASATSATIARGQFGTAARQHTQDTEWVHGPIASNATAFSTMADDQGDYLPLGAWVAYTPTNVNVTLGNGSEAARFIRLGRTIFWSYRLTWGSTTAFGGTVEIGLPVAARDTSNIVAGSAMCIDATSSDFIAVPCTTTNGIQLRLDAGSVVNATTPFTWTTSDVLTIAGNYESLT